MDSVFEECGFRFFPFGSCFGNTRQHPKFENRTFFHSGIPLRLPRRGQSQRTPPPAPICEAISEGVLKQPLRAFQVSDEKRLASLKKKAAKKEAEEPEKEKAIRCRHCGSRITTAGDRINMNGQHRHVFNNPAGYIFEIGCFGKADGCASRGTATMEFTWFAGFSWRFAICGNCNAHLGWHYISSAGNSFHGLILDHLTEEE